VSIPPDGAGPFAVKGLVHLPANDDLELARGKIKSGEALSRAVLYPYLVRSDPKDGEQSK